MSPERPLAASSDRRRAQPAGGTLLIRELPADERPRERLLAQGARALGDAELLAILLRTGRPGASAIEVAREILTRDRRAARASPGPARRGSCARGSARPRRRRSSPPPRSGGAWRGTTPSSAPSSARRPPSRATSRCATACATRRSWAPSTSTPATACSPSASSTVAPSTAPRSSRGRSSRRGCCTAPAAWSSSTPIPPATRARAPEDLAFTRRLAEGGELVGVRLVDHLILGGVGRWVSLRERGAW